MSSKSVEILLVEDNPGDVRLVRESFREGGLVNRLHVVANGEEALQFLRREDPYRHAPTPDLVLLDLNLPRKDGREVLVEIKADRKLRRIPVIVLTTSEAEQDILQAYDLNCNCYVAKPVDLEEFMRVIQAIDHFWLHVAALPPRE
jgi:chemotaxis family two-component system response regulator Rcp1